jgi:two-component system, OmpR family, alkaline phosphatase synthesis response regulator PhoP
MGTMSHGKTYSVLLVDDDTFLLDMYSLKFKQAGHSVEVARGGEEALAKLREKKMFDVMLFDIIMPSIDGFALLEGVRKEALGPGMLKVALSNQGAEADIAKAKSLGADGYIIKASAIPSEVLAQTTALLDARAH